MARKNGRRSAGWLTSALVLAVLFGVGPAWAQVPVVDFGDAPDDDLACQAEGFVVAQYPTQWGTTNAFPGRTAPFHKPPTPGTSDVFLGNPPTYEPLPPGALEPICDWVTGLTAPPPPPCDQDNGPVVLCLSPACTTGVLVGPGGTCDEVAASPFGPPVPVPAIGFWVFEVARSPGAARPAFANVAVDHSLDGIYGNADLEWILRDEPITAAPGASQFVLTLPFPVTTYANTSPPCSPIAIGFYGWCVEKLWNRFHVSDEALAGIFDTAGVSWDGSGRAGGYDGGETEDWVVATDPSFPFDDCDHNRVPDRVDFIFKRLTDHDGDGRYDQCSREIIVPDVRVVPALVDFGRVPVGGTSQQVVLIENAGRIELELVPLSLVGTHPQDFRILAGGEVGRVPPRGRRQVVVAFTPRAEGPRSATLAIRSNDPDTPLVHLPLQGLGERPARKVSELVR